MGERSTRNDLVQIGLAQIPQLQERVGRAHRQPLLDPLDELD